MATGSIRERESAKGESYQIIIELEKDATTGKRNRTYKTIYGTKKDAERVLREMLHEIDSGVFVKNDDTTLKEFIEEWLNIYIKPFKSATTNFSYNENMERYVYPTIGNKKLQELKAIDIQKLYNQLNIKSTNSDKPLAPKSIRNIHMNLRAALDKAVEHELIQKNPAKKVELPKCQKYKADVYNKDEVKKLFELVEGTDLELAIHILIFLGLRRGEAMGLRWSHINFEKKTAKIIDNVTEVNTKPITKAPKSESGKREISIPDSLMTMLENAYHEYLSRKSINKDLEDYVIVKESGKPYKPSWFSLKVRRFLKKSDLRRIRLHDMRHTSATLMLQVGISPKVAQQRLGHADFSTTMDIYSHVMEEMEQEAAGKLNNIFSSNQNNV